MSQTSPETEIAEGMEALREIEVAWLSRELGRAIKNLVYPVGCGAAPTDYHLESAAKALFERYAKMIEMARTAGHAQCSQETAKLYDLASTIHDARFGPDYPKHLINSFDTEGFTGSEYCFRLARAVMTKFKVAAKAELSDTSTDRPDTRPLRGGEK